jgi:hypothetical protein
MHSFAVECCGDHQHNVVIHSGWLTFPYDFVEDRKLKCNDMAILQHAGGRRK